MMLAGGAGVGKTRLVAAILRKAEKEGFRLARGDLAPDDRQVPLASVLDLARSMRHRDGFDTLGSDLLDLRGDEGADNLGSRRILVRDIAELIIDATDRPTLLCFEDLQWADELSLEVVAELARLGRERPLLLVGAYRLDELPMGSLQREWRSRLISQRLGEEVRLQPLTRDETALVVTLILGTGLPAPREVVNAVYERTDGIPLHIEELLGALDDEARTDGRAIRSAHVPDTIEDAVLARYARLSEDAKAMARAGAVIGRCFAPDVLAGCVDRPVADLDGPLAELVEQSFLYPFDYLDRGFYDFRHQLLRDALYGTVPPTELRRLHARAGEFSAQLIGASEVHASVHFERAGLRAQAYRSALAGARAARAVTSRREAVELYRRAAANAPDDLGAEDRGTLYAEYCWAAFDIDDVPLILETAELARRYYLEAGMVLEAADMLSALAGCARRDVRPATERRQLLADAEAELAGLPESPGRTAVVADVRLNQAMMHLDAGDHTAARRLLDEARSLRLASSDPNPADIDYFIESVGVLGGRVDEGLQTMLDISRAARAAHQESTGVTGLRWTSWTAVRALDYPVARIGLEEGLQYASEIEQSYCRHVMAATAALIAWAAGRWDEAGETAAIELVENGSRRGTHGSREVLGFVAFGRGDVEQARQLLTETLATGQAAGEVDLILPTLWGLAETALVADEPQLALEWCQRALEIARPTDERSLLIPFIVTGVRAALAARRPETADQWLADLRELLADWQKSARPALDHAEGLLRTSTGSTIVARGLLESAIEGWTELGRTWETMWAKLDLAASLLRANREGEAIPVLRDARAIAESLGSEPVLARADELGSIARGRGAEEEPWRPLTAREFEVARLVADGLTNAAIGEQLKLSPRTVGAHVEHILAKLSFTRRAEIAAWVASMAAGNAAGVAS